MMGMALYSGQLQRGSSGIGMIFIFYFSNADL